MLDVINFILCHKPIFLNFINDFSPLYSLYIYIYMQILLFNLQLVQMASHSGTSPVTTWFSRVFPGWRQLASVDGKARIWLQWTVRTRTTWSSQFYIVICNFIIIMFNPRVEGWQFNIAILLTQLTMAQAYCLQLTSNV